MNVLTIYAHHNPRSFCHAVLERFAEGLRDAGHTNEVVDLYAIRFNPVFDDRDGPDWIDESVPDDVLENMHVKRSLMEGARTRRPTRRGAAAGQGCVGRRLGLRGPAGRLPLLTHEKALVIQTTIWNEESYEAGLKAAMKVLVDEYALHYPGIKRIEHEYFHAVLGADDATRRVYLDRANWLGREF